jgi:ElaA protein
MVKIKLLHFNREYGGKTVAHARLFKPGISFDNASIGRVVVDENYRSKNGGHDLMHVRPLCHCQLVLNETKITIGGQLYLKNSMKVTALCKQVKCI